MAARVGTPAASARFLVWKAKRDLRSVARHGPAAPRLFQSLWFDIEALNSVSQDFLHIRWAARVLGGDWDRDVEPVEDLFALRACRERWIEGKSWESTGAYDRLLERIDKAGEPVDGCFTRADVIARFERLDRIFERVQCEGRLRPGRELRGRIGGDPQDVRIHVGRDGRPIFAMSGNHRLAIARIAKIRWVPAQLQVLHPDAISQWHEHVRRQAPPAVATLGSGT